MAGFLGRLGLSAGPDLAEAARGYASLADRGAREAFLHTLRAVVDLEGQRVSATDRLYLAERLPTLLIWGTDDPIIPIEHARAARARIPESRLVEIAGAGHWPQLDDPDRFVAELSEFVETTEPHVFDLDRMRRDAEARARARRRDRVARAARPAQASSRSPCASGSCLSFFSVLFSIWRTRSRVTPKARPTSSSVSGSCPRSP